jgi:hypothetical protein
MSANDKHESGKAPAIRDLQDDEIDGTSGAAATRTPSWIDPDPDPVQSPKVPSWTDPEPVPVQSPKTPGWVDPDPQPIR